MSQKTTTGENQNELSWEDAVSRYLEDNPDYFQHHPEILAGLKISHAAGGKTVSLIERQVTVLREQNQALERQLRELITNARENDVLGDRLHRFAAALVDSGSLVGALDSVYELLRREFKLDAVAIFYRADPAAAGGRREIVGADKKLDSLLRQFSAGKPICGGRFEDGLLRHLFGEQAAAVKSSAMIPLGTKVPLGALCLGSSDPHRFHPGMGTVYLARLGELLTHGLARHCPA
ncbi:MAG: hypothetical protein A2V92_01230 [Candidatus Muproteobacteria bacterium RBG_16_65_31]|uniref:Phytochrome sensor protein n=1 Tax=Candidatus Muproteobacteria bacterium RBG_16_65_31 TaxID=1817759 RepID=A0A1F6TG44_9PROT|nr:MAG: hypothetical protein A2V92_01230 [Candidatus Muproteobacteria bacterium RBG_16_65_31]